MTLTKIPPQTAAIDFKRTKIIATVGPATDSYDAILGILKAGANGIRLNFSHGNNEQRDQQIAWIRQASLETSKPIALIADLQGPKIRLGDFEGVIPLQAGQNIRFRLGADYDREGALPTQYNLAKKVKRGEHLYLYDGKVKTIITSVKDDIVYARVQNDGVIISRKGINLPDTDFEGDIITIKDRKDIAYACEKGFDYVALSFLQTASDVVHLKRLLNGLNGDAKIIAKIETKAAAQNLEEIIEVTDAVMVARGDLAIETNLESVPILQRKIVGMCLKYSRPSIVATQMLMSMQDSPEPTRAEVGDVATAVLMGADAIMLSDETATGKYPIEAVKMMKRIVKYTQADMSYKTIYQNVATTTDTPQDAISKAIITLAESVGAAAIIAETKSGATALKIAAQRPKLPVIVATSSQRIAQQLAIVHSSVTFIRKDEQYQATKLAEWLKIHKVLKKGDIVVTASGQQPGVVGTTDTIKVRALE